LHIAVRKESVDIFETLIGQMGRDEVITNMVNTIKDESGLTPLHWAIISGNSDITKRLVSYKADVKAETLKKKQAIHFAAQSGRTNMIKLLLAHESIDVNACAEKEMTPVHYAARHGYTESVILLLHSGANILAKTKEGKTCLDFAAEKVERGDETLCQYLVSHDKWHELMSSVDKSGKWPMAKLIKNAPETAKRILDNSKEIKSILPSTHPDYLVTYNYEWIDNNHIGKPYFGPYTMAKYHREDLIEHPVTQAIIDLKWKSISKWYFTLLVIYAVFISLLSALVHDEKIRDRNQTQHNISNQAQHNISNQTQHNISDAH
jgi:hypothetical protein